MSNFKKDKNAKTTNAFQQTETTESSKTWPRHKGLKLHFVKKSMRRTVLKQE